MKVSFYLRYATRSLARGGQRTMLAVFCIAVGVMAIVGLQLASGMVRLAITGNARAINQGDLSVGLQSTPIGAPDLSFFEDLKSRGTITGFAPLESSPGIVQLPDGRRHTVSVRVVDPSNFPLVGSGRLLWPGGASASSVLERPGAAIAASRLADDMKLPLGSRLRVVVTSGTMADLSLAGAAPTDNASWTGNSLTVSADTWEALSKAPVSYQTVSVTTASSARSAEASRAIRRQFPLANIRTTDDVLKQAERAVEITRKFLVVIGLLALLIGGVGIVNTMQVLLSRRRVEIAVLKTFGFRRRELYLLFGLEAALLGLGGGATGSLLGVGVASALRALFIRAFPIIIPFELDLGTLLSGFVIGAATAIIFGILPIVRAAAIRPQDVLRDRQDWQMRGEQLQSISLILLLSLLFCVLASLILKSLVWGALTVYGVSLLLGVISIVLSAVLWLLSRIPIPDRMSVRYMLAVTLAVVGALGLMRLPTLRGVGILALAFSLIGYVILLFPSSWRVGAKLALRNIGRTRGRTTATLLALLVGVFVVGFILTLGQGLHGNLAQAITGQLQYNVIAVSTQASGAGIPDVVRDVPGLERWRSSDFVATSALSIRGMAVADSAFTGTVRASARLRRQLRQLNGLQGYDLAAGDSPDFVEVTTGRALSAQDDGTANVIVPEGLREPPLRLGIGDVVGIRRLSGETHDDLTVVGFYRLNGAGSTINFNLASILSARSEALQLAGGTPFAIYYLQVSPGSVERATRYIESAAPDSIVFDIDDLLSQFVQILNNILLMLSAIASLALLAGLIIVANAVALAMLERRREMGILKAVGYGAGRVLSGVLVENALTAGLAGLLGMAPVSVAVAIFNRQAGVSFGVGAPLAIAVMLGVIVLTTITTGLVAWGAVQVRPLTVLRYE